MAHVYLDSDSKKGKNRIKMIVFQEFQNVGIEMYVKIQKAGDGKHGAYTCAAPNATTASLHNWGWW